MSSVIQHTYLLECLGITSVHELPVILILKHRSTDNTLQRIKLNIYIYIYISHFEL